MQFKIYVYKHLRKKFYHRHISKQIEMLEWINQRINQDYNTLRIKIIYIEDFILLLKK